jgi:predicted DNA-binding protein
MAQPKKPPLAVRVSDDLKARIDAWATDHGLKRNSAVVALIESGLAGVGADDARDSRTARKRLDDLKKGQAKTVSGTELEGRLAALSTRPSPKAVLAQAQVSAAHLGTERPHSRWDLKNVHLGPVERPAGSLLKHQTKGKR